MGGRIIKTPAGAATRPTAQFAREALFNILAPRMAGAVFIDLFAGSGAVGIEALSRGAGGALFVERNRACCELIRANLTALGVDKRRYCVLEADMSARTAKPALLRGLDRLARPAADIVFADPPYEYAGMDGLPLLMSGLDVCAPGGILIIEHGKKSELPAAACAYVKYDVRKYGDTRFSFYYESTSAR